MICSPSTRKRSPKRSSDSFSGDAYRLIRQFDTIRPSADFPGRCKTLPHRPAHSVGFPAHDIDEPGCDYGIELGFRRTASLASACSRSYGSCSRAR